jgi:methyltransferase (TIGR00027 family)
MPLPTFATTARWIAAARARESGRPDALFSDSFAHFFAGETGAAMLDRSERASGGENLFLAVRTRYFDEALLAAAQVCGQVVLLGAGFDVRAYRLPLPAGTRMWELDQAELLAEKESVLTANAAAPRCERMAVAADLAASWGEALAAAGHDVARPTVWLAEGLLYYLSAPAVAGLLRLARAHSAGGSVFLADVFGTGLLAQPAMQPYLRWLEQAALPQPFCTDDPARLLAAGGWRAEGGTRPGAPDANYGRFPRGPRPAPPAGGETRQAYFVRAMAAD